MPEFHPSTEPLSVSHVKTTNEGTRTPQKNKALSHPEVYQNRVRKNAKDISADISIKLNFVPPTPPLSKKNSGNLQFLILFTVDSFIRQSDGSH